MCGSKLKYLYVYYVPLLEMAKVLQHLMNPTE